MKDLCGFYGFDGAPEQLPASGYEVLGAVTSARRTLPRGGKIVTKQVAAKKHPYHAAPGAANAAKRATAAAIRATKPSKRSFKEISVRGIFGDVAMLGVVGGPPIATKKPLTPRQVAAVNKYNAAAKKTVATAANAQRAGANAMNVAKKVAADVKNASGAVKALMAKQTKMRGLDEVVGAGYEEVVGLDYAQVQAYCDITGEYEVDVFGKLEESGITVYGGYDPAKFNVYGDIEVFGADETATMAAEAEAQQRGHGVAVARTGACACPKCGVTMRLVLAPPPSVLPGKPAGVLVAKPAQPVPVISGEIGAAQVLRPAKATPAIRAASPGSCLAACPGCGAVLHLSVGPGGYDARGVNAQAPRAYAAVAHAVHGDDITVFGADESGLFPGQVGYDPETIEVYGEEITVFGLDASGKGPGEPGYDPSTDPASPGYQPPPDPAFQETPEKPVIPAVPIERAVAKVPEDGVPYAGEKGWPRYKFGSLEYFNGGKYGWVWGWNKGNWPNDNMSPRWICRFGQAAVTNNDNWDDFPSPVTEPGEVSNRSLAGKKADGTIVAPSGTFGPLVGDPDDPDFKNLRWATADKKWFWYLEEAPKWATAELEYAAAKLLQAEQAAQKAEADALAAEAARAAAENEAAMAQQKAAEALAESAEESRAKIEASQQAGQKSQQEIDQAKADAEQKRADAKQARADAALAAEQQRAEFAAAQAEQQAALAAQQAEQQAVAAQQQADLAAQMAEQRNYQAAQAAQMELDRQAAEIDLQNQRAQAAYAAANPQQFYSQEAQQQAPPQQSLEEWDSYPEKGGPDPFADPGLFADDEMDAGW